MTACWCPAYARPASRSTWRRSRTRPRCSPRSGGSGSSSAPQGRADSVAGALRDTFAAVAADVPAGPRPTALYLIAEDPPRTAGPGTFIGQAIEIAGAVPAFPELAEDWPTVALEAVMARSPDVIVLPVGADLPAREALAGRPGWRDLAAVREGRIVEIEADLLARPGPDLGRAARVLREGLSAVGEDPR